MLQFGMIYQHFDGFISGQGRFLNEQKLGNGVTDLEHSSKIQFVDDKTADSVHNLPLRTSLSNEYFQLIIFFL